MGLLGAVFLIVLIPIVALILTIVHYIKRLLRAGSIPVHERGAVMVTGASSGIGRHAAESLAALGYTVFGTVRKESDAAKLREVIQR
jgi:NADPH:quinone reductase-like Zn-dependent oxidoreductase